MKYLLEDLLLDVGCWCGFGLALSNAMLLQDSLEDQVNGTCDNTCDNTTEYVDENLICDEKHRGPFFKVR